MQTSLCYIKFKYPSNLKRLKLHLYSKEDKSDPNNYRSISVLSIISIFERHISKSITKLMDKFELIYHHQSGFRKQHSCYTVLTKIVDNWLAAKNENNILAQSF